MKQTKRKRDRVAWQADAGEEICYKRIKNWGI